MVSLASLVPCGMARKLPMYVDTDFSRSNIASTYSGLTAPASTRIWPASRIASSFVAAVPGTLIWDNVKMSLILRKLLCQGGVFGRGGGADQIDPTLGRDQLGAALSCLLVTFSSSTIASYFGLFMKLSTETCCALGDIVCARGVRS